MSELTRSYADIKSILTRARSQARYLMNAAKLCANRLISSITGAYYPR